MSLTEDQIRDTFSAINAAALPAPAPPPWALNEHIKSLHFSKNRCIVDQQSRILLFGASLDLWQRALHSLLLSMSLTKKSPLWSASSGYYSSHYAVRAFANLFGCCVTDIGEIKTSLSGTNLVFQLVSKERKEHSQYWAICATRLGPPSFPNNTAKGPVGDKTHRTTASYADHLPAYAEFKTDPDYDLVQRSEELCGIRPAIPSLNSFPDLDHVQAIALARILRYRDFMDDIFGLETGVWSKIRQPLWCPFDLGIQYSDQSPADFIH